MVVVGGGPGGMKVAEIAARRGHEVILYESDAELGGQVKLAEKGPSRADIGEVTHWLGVQIKKLGVKVRTGVAATAEVVEAEKPDVVVIATGARPVRPGNIAGSEQGNVFTPWEVMAGTAEVGQKVIVYSSWRAQAAASAAEFLANQGKEIEIVTSTPFFGMELPPGAMIPPYLRLLEKGVKFTPFLAIVQIQGDRITLINVISQQPEERAGIDSVVLSTPAKANDELYFALKGRVREIYRVGDCVAPRHIDAAVYDGEMVGRTL